MKIKKNELLHSSTFLVDLESGIMSSKRASSRAIYQKKLCIINTDNNPIIIIPYSSTVQAPLSETRQFH